LELLREQLHWKSPICLALAHALIDVGIIRFRRDGSWAPRGIGRN
jgi:hypothetical protein